ncbi:MAG TPA: hypothetical protein VKR58_02665 [Aquella sp.]|nr:hypothetical protein [Aquella sp.]
MNPEDPKDVDKVLNTLLSLQEEIINRLDTLLKESKIKKNTDFNKLDANINKLVDDLKQKAREELKAYEKKLADNKQFNRILNLLK